MVLGRFEEAVNVCFENNRYVKSIGTLNSTLGTSAKIEFNINLILDPSIFNYLASPQQAVVTSTAASSSSPAQSSAQPESLTPATQTPPILTPLTTPSTVNSTTQNASPNNSPTQSAASNVAVPANTVAQNTTPSNSAVQNTAPAGIPTIAQQAAQASASEKIITSFHILLNPEAIGLIDQANHKITVVVPAQTNLKNLIPLITISPGDNINPASEAAQDFTKPINYIVTAQDGSSQNYIVSVVSVLGSSNSKKKNNSATAILAAMILIAVVIIAAIIFIFIWRKNKQK